MSARTYTLPTTRNQRSSRPHLKRWMRNPVIYPDWAENLYGANSELSRFSLLFLLALLDEKKAFQPPAANPRVNSYTPGTVADPVISARMKWRVRCLLLAWFSLLKNQHTAEVLRCSQGGTDSLGSWLKVRVSSASVVNSWNPNVLRWLSLN